MTNLHFKVSPAVLGPLGLEQLQDPALAVLELIKNSWDADATRVTVSISPFADGGAITVTDDGHGMTQQDFAERWLVIGASTKRHGRRAAGERPLIGEKGLGRLASFSLGNRITIASARMGGTGFSATVDWNALTSTNSLEEYAIPTMPGQHPPGTSITIQELKSDWTQGHTAFLVSHAELLTAIPGENFRVTLSVDGKKEQLGRGTAGLDKMMVGYLEVRVGDDGSAAVRTCTIQGDNMAGIAYRPLRASDRDTSLAGAIIRLKFFLREDATAQLSNVLPRRAIVDALERYQGIRVYRDGINVPPYGLNGDDWAALEKQRTATGGPTMVPGNSQLVGEVHLDRRRHRQFVVTAGRAGFTDQSAVGALARYVRWAAKLLGTARRAHHLGIRDSATTIPGRIDESRFGTKANTLTPKERLAAVARAPAVAANPTLRKQLKEAAHAINEAFARTEQTLRLYAQLASTGIAATSFSHELRSDFDVVSEALSEIGGQRARPDPELMKLLVSSWRRIRTFAALFKVIPVKIRRQKREMTAEELRVAAETVLRLAPPDTVTTEVSTGAVTATLVPAELDAILLNLVTNAVKAIAASETRGKGRIRVSFSGEGTALVLTVMDNGCGIAENVTAIMFEPLEGAFDEGTGMGLPIVKYIAERYEGTATTVKAPKGYTTAFQVTLRGVGR